MWIFFAQLWFWVWLLSAVGLSTFAWHSYHYHHRLAHLRADHTQQQQSHDHYTRRAFRSGDFIGYVLPLALYTYTTQSL